MNWEHLPLGYLTEIYSVSNTASFLYARYRENLIVQAIAKKPLDLIVVEIKRIVSLEKVGLEDVVKAYACLVALSFHHIKEVKQSLKDVSLLRFRWAYQLIAIMETTGRPSAYLVVPYQPSIEQSGNKKIASATHVSRYLIER